MEQRILGAYQAELERSRLPGYVSPDLPDDDDYLFDHDAFLPPPLTAGRTAGSNHRGRLGEGGREQHA